MEIKLKVELPEKLDETLDCICSSLWSIAKAMTAGVPADAPAAAPATVEHPADVNPPATADDMKPATPAHAEEPAVKTFTASEVQKAVRQAAQVGPEVKAKVKELVNRFADTVPGIPAEKYPEVMAGIKAIVAEFGGAA